MTKLTTLAAVLAAAVLALTGTAAASLYTTFTGCSPYAGVSCQNPRPPKIVHNEADPDPDEVQEGVSGQVQGGDGAALPDLGELLEDTPEDRIRPSPCAWKMCSGDEGPDGLGLIPENGNTGVCSPWCIVIVPPPRSHLPIQRPWQAPYNDPPTGTLPNNDTPPEGTSGSCLEYAPTPDPTDDPAATACSYWQHP